MEETHSCKRELDDHLALQPVGRGKDEPDLSPTHFVDHAAPLPGWRPTLASPQSTRTRPIGSWTARRVMRNCPDPQSWDLASRRRGDPQRAEERPRRHFPPSGDRHGFPSPHIWSPDAATRLRASTARQGQGVSARCGHGAERAKVGWRRWTHVMKKRDPMNKWKHKSGARGACSKDTSQCNECPPRKFK